MSSILLTGASRGIGEATALELARAGHHVFATMRNPEGSPSLGREAEAESLPIEIMAMDVNSGDSVRRAVEEITDRAGMVDALVNNAGIEKRGAIEELDLGEFRAVMETNYFGAIRCMQAVLPAMRERGSGTIINVSSVAGRISSSPLGSYAATKFALEAVTEALSQEVTGHGIRVYLVQPGIIDTDMARGMVDRWDESNYPHERRFAGLFRASLAHADGPGVVASKIRELIEGESTVLRHPVGADAQPFLDWRASMSDEEWARWGAQDDESWYAAVERDFGLDARLD